ncbi:MAG: hypothetical protein ACTH2Q_01185 [Propionibacteriaceae bacterium]
MSVVADPHRLALAVAVDSALAPPGVDPAAFTRACLADTYEVLAGLAEVQAGVAGLSDQAAADLLWPGDRALPPGSPYELAGAVAGAGAQDRAGAQARTDAQGVDELVLVAGDAPDLPALVIAKMFRALRRAEVCVAPDRTLPGCVALGVRLPWPDWLPSRVDLADPLATDLEHLVPVRGALAITPDWHRLRTPEAVHRLDPGLEGWEETRLLLS